jgi:hypothetical protein
MLLINKDKIKNYLVLLLLEEEYFILNVLVIAKYVTGSLHGP